MNLELSNLTPEIRAAIAAIASLGSAPVTLRETVILETPDEIIGALLKKILVNHLVVNPLEYMVPPAKNQTKAARIQTHIEPRICEACGQSYEPRRKDQKFCVTPECRRTRGKPAPAVEVPAEPAPLASQ